MILHPVPGLGVTYLSLWVTDIENTVELKWP